MRAFTVGKAIKRQVTIRSSDRALPNTDWIITMTADGLRLRRLGARREDNISLSWRSVIGHALIHKGK